MAEPPLVLETQGGFESGVKGGECRKDGPGPASCRFSNAVLHCTAIAPRDIVNSDAASGPASTRGAARAPGATAARSRKATTAARRIGVEGPFQPSQPPASTCGASFASPYQRPDDERFWSKSEQILLQSEQILLVTHNHYRFRA